MRFILIDRITEFKPGRRAEAIKNVTLSEDFFDDHFPLKPVMPGVLILEGLAEIAGLLLEETVREQEGTLVKALLSMVEKAKFRDFVKPGDQLAYRATIQSINEAGGKIAGEILREGKRIGDARLLYTFHVVDDPHLNEIRDRHMKFWMEYLNE